MRFYIHMSRTVVIFVVNVKCKDFIMPQLVASYKIWGILEMNLHGLLQGVEELQ